MSALEGFSDQLLLSIGRTIKKYAKGIGLDGNEIKAVIKQLGGVEMEKLINGRLKRGEEYEDLRKRLEKLERSLSNGGFKKVKEKLPDKLLSNLPEHRPFAQPDRHR